jgi:hypothetical protein
MRNPVDLAHLFNTLEIFQQMGAIPTQRGAAR